MNNFSYGYIQVESSAPEEVVANYAMTRNQSDSRSHDLAFFSGEATLVLIITR